MKNLLTETLNAAGGILANIADLFVTLFAWAGSVLLIVHNDMPRLEGLLVGILLAWFFVHREKNPVLRALAAPLKIVLDILDIVWDETIEAALDLYGSAKEKVVGGIVWCKDKAMGLVGGLTGFLSRLKDDVLKKKDKEE
jgi:hypothetical protein